MSQKITNSFVFFIILSIIFATFILYNRSILENNSRRVELVMSLDELRELAYQEGYDEEELLLKMKAAGIHSIAIHEDNLEKLKASGDVLFFPKEEFNKYQFFLNTFKIGNRVQISPGESYIIFNDENEFTRIKENLRYQLGEKAVEEYNLLTIKSLKVTGNAEKVLELGLGFSQKDMQWLNNLGFEVILRFKNYQNIDKERIKLKFAEANEIDMVSAIIFDGESVLGFPSKEKMLFTAEILKENQFPFGMIEFANQEGIKTIAYDANTLTVKVHSITKEEMEIISSQKAIDRWIRAAKERKVRIFYVKPFRNSELDLFNTNFNYVNTIRERLSANGFGLGRASLYSDIHLSIVFLFLLGLGVISGGIILLNHLANIEKKYNYMLLGLAVVVSIVLFLADMEVQLIKILALLSALIFPTLAIASNISYFNKPEFSIVSGEREWYDSADSRYLLMIKNILIGFFRIITLTLCGALLIAALLSNGKFILGIDQFSGIKLSYLLPLLLVLIVLWSNQNQGKMLILDTLKKPILIEHALIIGFFAVFLVVYIARSGNFSFLPVLGIEEKIRVFLEKTLIARPRNKVFLIGYPALILAMSMNYLKIKEYRIPIIIVGTIGPVTLINTFCHIHTPFTFSLLRAFNGIWLGTLLGLIIVSVFYFIVKQFRKFINNEKN